MPSRSLRAVVLAASTLASLLSFPTGAKASGAVLPPTEGPIPMYVHMRTAVAISATGSTRWSQVTVPAQSRAMWLVPVRPGAAVDWTSDRWLDALEQATTPHVLPPTEKAVCKMPEGAEQIAQWTPTSSTKSVASAPVIRTTASEVTAYAAERGYRLSSELAARITTLYQGGWLVVALELGSSATATTSGTLRVSDDGGAVLPLAITGGAAMHLTAFAIGAGVATVSRTVDVETRALRWGFARSNYETWREGVLQNSSSTAWLRESASHDAIFDGTSMPGAFGIPSVVERYFDDPSCADAAWRTRSSTGTVGTTCAPGAAVRVPGGAACVPSSGSVDPASLSCSDKLDLALALSGLTPESAVLTRWSTAATASTFKTNLAVELEPTAARRPPVVRAGSYEMCMAPPESSPPTTTAPPMRAPTPTTSETPTEETDTVVVSDGCSGGAVVPTGESDDTESAEPVAEDTSSDSCSSDSSGWESSDESDGWDDSDSDGCSTDDDSSSSSSESCSSDSSSDSDDSSDSEDGWDTEDEMSPSAKKVRPAAKKPHAARTKKTRSPVSRFALLGAALLLPLRRRRRGQEDDTP